jgi:hypothetical protein
VRAELKPHSEPPFNLVVAQDGETETGPSKQAKDDKKPARR